MDIYSLDPFDYVHIPSGHDITRRANEVGGRGVRGFYLEEFGLFCPWGEREFSFLQEKTGKTLLKSFKWCFIVADKKKWLITKIKYGL